MWVIKLGGSVTEQTTLIKWLQTVARFGDGKVIIVPGGGLFADAVRAFQTMRAQLLDGHVSDAHAHALAVYAMDQMARSFVAMVPELVLVRNPLEIAERGWQHRGMVWLPSQMVLNTELCSEAEIPHTWEVTSDSLAVWLAQHLQAYQLLLIKSDHRLLPAQSSWSSAQLISHSCLDAKFQVCMQKSDFPAWVMHHSAVDTFAHGFCQSRLTGRLIT